VIRVRVTVVRRRLVLRRAIQLGAVLGTPVILQRGVEKVGHLAHRLADVGASLHERTRDGVVLLRPLLAAGVGAGHRPTAAEPAVEVSHLVDDCVVGVVELAAR